MTPASTVLSIIRNTPELMRILTLIRDCHLKQGALAAGSIRNTVWQVLSGQPVSLGSDIDVVFFDPDRPASDDLKIYAQLTQLAPEYQWQVKNEVYMAHYNFPDTPDFTSVDDAIGHFVEVPTCVGAYLNGDALKLIAPHGVDDLVDFRCRPIPFYQQDERHRAIYRQRVAAKQWQKKWPQLQVAEV